MAIQLGMARQYLKPGELNLWLRGAVWRGLLADVEELLAAGANTETTGGPVTNWARG